MREFVQDLVFSFAFPIIVFAVGMTWSKLVGGWQDSQFRKWWTTFCLAMPFACFGMMIKSMGEDNFYDLRGLWFAERFGLIAMVAIAVALSILAVVAIVRLWRTSQ